MNTPTLWFELFMNLHGLIHKVAGCLFDFLETPIKSILALRLSSCEGIF